MVYRDGWIKRQLEYSVIDAVRGVTIGTPGPKEDHFSPAPGDRLPRGDKIEAYYFMWKHF